mmetsp:Transcript_17889/g.35323  ORF Transcript_17889/g.35323 Transcript_17889/m.35323 type:complete len:119 (+) Transcript_17889:318-674(+)
MRPNLNDPPLLRPHIGAAGKGCPDKAQLDCALSALPCILVTHATSYVRVAANPSNTTDLDGQTGVGTLLKYVQSSRHVRRPRPSSPRVLSHPLQPISTSVGESPLGGNSALDVENALQ